MIGKRIATDEDAIHDNVAGEIVDVSEKSTPADNDLILIEDSADSNNKKKIKITNLPGGNYLDNEKLYFGTDNDFYFMFNPTSDCLELYDLNDNLIFQFVKG